MASKSAPTLLNVFLTSWISAFLNNIDYTRSLIEIMLRLVIHVQKIYPVLFHHNKKSLNSRTGNIKPCNYRKKDECHLNGQCLAQDVVCKCIASTSMNPEETYLGIAEGDFKKR